MAWRLRVLLGASIVIALPLASLARPPVPDVPKEIAVPPGYQLLFKVRARGVQIYKAVEGKAGKPEWLLEAPLADLFGEKGGKFGWHYAGPSWEAVDGSRVVRDQAEEVKSAPAPRPQEDVPWLLLKARAVQGKGGALSPVVYIQRLQTEGGKAPADLPRQAGAKAGVAYRAVYYFYGKAR
jgi:hypothetical protein